MTILHNFLFENLSTICSILMVFTAIVITALVCTRNCKSGLLRRLVSIGADMLVAVNTIFIVVALPVHLFFYHTENCPFCEQHNK